MLGISWGHVRAIVRLGSQLAANGLSFAAADQWTPSRCCKGAYIRRL